MVGASWTVDSAWGEAAYREAELRRAARGGVVPWPGTRETRPRGGRGRARRRSRAERSPDEMRLAG
ncbi:hypothetical protein B1813_05930 [Saccharomonospora piscinae]|uniref:Uncharacterized protein n=1 Tax=Saccharomonospora piscinae TaxID=687388 RepID=A0A1V9AAE5_SACPI|nr:hypothetical protein [Saccharomonospora piscinae]OQO94041.1 hypothetical protein B1813_05930 [Saccharomonospora piscinae]TLW95214.1 hypothetical protein FFT09_05080 [Saccharomonospora piscinae]